MVTTPNLGLTKPIVGDDEDIWGDMLNANSDLLDSLVVRKTGDTMTGSLIVPDLLVEGASQFNDLASFPGGALITGGVIDDTMIGLTTPSIGNFTDLSASGTVSGAGFVTLLAPYAKINSQAFTGTPSLPTGTIAVTQTAGDASTKIATTAFVGAAITAKNLGTMSTQNANAVAIIGGSVNSTSVGATTASSGAFTTLSASGTVSGAGFVTLLAPYAKIDSQAFTGTPSLPTGTTGVTQAAADSTTKLATTAFVKSQNYLTGNQTITHTGDVTGSGTTSIPNTVVQLQGRPLSASAPATGNLMGWNGSTWGPVAAGAAAAGGTNGQIQYNNSGILGGISQNGSGTVLMTTGAVGANFGSTVTVTGTASGAFFALTKAAGAFDCIIYGQKGGVSRWQINLADATTEGGSNAGSDFSISRWTDAGAALDSPLKIVRSTGVATFSQTVNSAGLTVAPAAGFASLYLNKPISGSTSAIYGQKAAVNRWSMEFGNSVVEGGSDAGSNFSLSSYSDAGASVGTPLQVRRDCGYTYLNGNGATPISASFEAAPFGHSALRLNKAGSAKTAVISGNNNGAIRWGLELGDSSPESTGNNGSDFTIGRYSDAGTYIDAPLKITRANGAVSVLGGTSISKDSVEVGAPAQNAAAFIDFHSGASSNDFDARIISTGGAAAVGNGNLQILAASTTFANGSISTSGTISASGSISSAQSLYAVGVATTNGNFYSQSGGAENYINVSDTSLNGGQYRNLSIRGLDTSGTVETNFQILRVAANAVNCAGTLNAASTITGQANIVASGVVDAISCFYGRSGAGGANNGNFNFYWTSSVLNAYIGSVYIGYVSIVSDYRIKKDIAPLPSMWDRVKTLNPISYTQRDFTPPRALQKNDDIPAGHLFVADDVERWGFVAHELQETLVESAASGVKDDPDGVQSPNPWTVIATLTKALQEAMARIEALEAA